jgi:hypothetical protein
MDLFFGELRKRAHQPLEKILFVQDLIRRPGLEKQWINFACLSVNEIRAQASDFQEFLLFSSAQCMCKDFLAINGGMSLSTFLKSQNATSFWNIRLEPRELYKAQGMPFFGCREPVKTSKENIFNSKLIARMRYISDVLRVKTFISFEARNFKNEEKAWNLVCSGRGSCELIKIEDWTLPSTDALVRFIVILQESVEREEHVLGHCIAGNGRTGICLLFSLALRHDVFNIVKLLKLLATGYKYRASSEIITMVERNKLSIYELFRRFHSAFIRLQEKLQNKAFFIALNSRFPSYSSLSANFSSSQLRELRDHGLKSR